PAGKRESGDFTLIDWPETQQGNDDDAGNAGAPGFIIGDTGPTSGDDLVFGFSPEDGTIHGLWLQLIPSAVTPEVPVEIPLAGAVSGAIAEGPFGAVTGVPVPEIAVHRVTVDNPYVSLGTLDSTF